MHTVKNRLDMSVLLLHLLSLRHFPLQLCLTVWMNNVEGCWLGSICEYFFLKFRNVSVEISFVNIAERLLRTLQSQGYIFFISSLTPKEAIVLTLSQWTKLKQPKRFDSSQSIFEKRREINFTPPPPPLLP